MKTKKPYKKPEIKKVPLRPQEMVLGFCKDSHSRRATHRDLRSPKRRLHLGILKIDRNYIRGRSKNET